jgi:hypothetical protein
LAIRFAAKSERRIFKEKQMKRKNRKGQSMVEYAIGIGAVTAVCMLVLGGLGHASADVVRQVLLNINDSDDQSADPGSIFTNGVSGTTNAPWNPQ